MSLYIAFYEIYHAKTISSKETARNQIYEKKFFYFVQLVFVNINTMS